METEISRGNELSGYITHTIVLLFFFADVVQRVRGISSSLRGREGGRVECYLRKYSVYRYLHSPHQRMSLDAIIVFPWQR